MRMGPVHSTAFDPIRLTMRFLPLCYPWKDGVSQPNKRGTPLKLPWRASTGAQRATVASFPSKKMP